MDINQLIKIVKNKIEKNLEVESIIIEDKTFLHLNHKSHEKNKFHLKLTIKSKYLNKINKIESNKLIYKIIKNELNKYIHSIQISLL
tara:strand:+ start:409 stop:669 length:261 start_codon:yes stop_codon:yes gene_type:complete